jgi:hypothetical protein
MLEEIVACGQKVVQVTSNQWLHLKESEIVDEEEELDSSIAKLVVDCLVVGRDVQGFGGYLLRQE